jgi:hypothetical protein
MSHHSLGRARRDPLKEFCYGLAFRRVVERRGGAVSIDVIDLRGGNAGAGQRAFHGLARPASGRIRLR